ncbi:HD domain-containing protein [Bradyrhizobium erythrophlei]|uniref:5'-deoxynucleotidase YfbR n=1 Tax=Bradyrhizobium erythrophlei TaxID=1437360 RepID=A0A1M7TS44_9BRAD|nr:HD domain-containing protein [Bradyrhizobium erythrophlei]SHN73500.1 5'-deoxynucleotidase YfbR [Bradyrhizobium erythrophlei]
MATDPIDVLILVALTEEARIFHRDGFYPLREQPNLESFPYHAFDYVDDGGHRRTGMFVVAGEIGPRIRDAAVVFAREYSPKFVLNVGISGMIKDAKVGDVVVPTHLNVIDHRSAAQDDNEGGYEILTGGKPAPVSSIASSIVNSVPFQEANKIDGLFAFARASSVKLTEEEKRNLRTWQSRNKLAEAPAIVSGPFAISNMLMKSEKFKESVLRRSDRNYVAADMESGLISDGLLALKVPPPFYAIRAISDPATSEKAEYDAIGKGVIRQWAMANARQTVKLLLRQPKLFGAEQASLAKASLVHSADYSSDYPGQRIVTSLEPSDFDDRFANLELSKTSSRGPDEVLGSMKFSEFAVRVCGKVRKGRFLVQGRGGGGKSAVLKATQLYVRRMALSPETVFLNVRNVCSEAKSSTLEATLLQRINRDAPNLIGSQRSVVIFLDELFGHDDEPPLLDLLEELLAENEPTFIFAFGRDHFELITTANDSSKEPYIFDLSFDLVVDLKAISIRDEERAKSVIAGMAKTCGFEAKLSSVEILASLKRLGFSYLNHFVISIFLDNFEKLAFTKLENGTLFVLRSMENLYFDTYGRIKDPSFNLICVEAMRSYCRALAKSNAKAERRTKAADRYSEAFAHFPRVVQTALIAQATVYILAEFNKVDTAFRSLGMDEKAFLGLVFSDDVNKNVKDLLSDPRIEETVLAAARKILSKLEPPGLSYALYLFGRARSAKGKRAAQAAFDDVAPHLLDRTEMPKEEQSMKFWRLARRSLQISRSMNQNREATDSYISDVLSDPYEDGLNRSFHLEYYRDHQSTGMTVELELEDKGGSWSRTRHILGQRISDALKGASKEYDRICILTYFSLVRFRHEKGNLATADREEELGLITRVLGSDINLGDRLRAFLVMVHNSLSKPVYSSIDAILELYALKSLPRAGWIERKFSEKGEVIETVASHVFGTMLLAELLCNCVTPPVTEEERSKILQLLVYHDLAEAYIGDYTPADGATKAKEGPAIERIATLATYQNLSRLTEIATRWREFELGTDRCGALARDFDKLDAVFQAFAYIERFSIPEDRRQFIAYCRDQIASPSLREIAEEIFRRATHFSS